MSATEWDDYAERNPPRLLREPMQRRGSEPKAMLGLAEDRSVIGEGKFTKRVSVNQRPKAKCAAKIIGRAKR